VKSSSSDAALEYKDGWEGRTKCWLLCFDAAFQFALSSSTPRSPTTPIEISPEGQRMSFCYFMQRFLLVFTVKISLSVVYSFRIGVGRNTECFISHPTLTSQNFSTIFVD